MKRFFESRAKLIGFWFALLLFPFTVNAAPGGEVIFTHPIHKRGIWISNVDGSNARRLFNPPLIIYEISVQEGDRYILVVGEGLEGEIGLDAYLFDRRKPGTKRKDLTLGWFGEVTDAAISRYGDVVFTNTINQEHPDGLYLIPSQEVWKPIPKAEKLFHGPAAYVDWAPNGEDIAFSNRGGIFLLNVFSGRTSLIAKEGFRPVFSPEGKYLAFCVRVPVQNDAQWTIGIAVTSLDAPAGVEVVVVSKNHDYLYPTWSADGKYIAYMKSNACQIGDEWEEDNFVVPVIGGNSEPIFHRFEKGVWAFEWASKTYPVEPLNSLVTTWGKLKAQKSTESIHE